MAISKQKTALFFRLSISVTVFGALFKFISWPLIILGATGMVIFHSIQFYQKQNRVPLDYSRHLLIVTFACNYIFSLLHLPYDYILTALTKVALIVFVLFYCKEIISLLLENAQNGLLLQKLGTENLSRILADLATVYIVIASLFKILHWEFGIINANVLLVIGLFTALISILASSKDFGEQETS
ncbi:hypothetical protein FEE95_02685 [Maribacter algarum]|uniref:Uncharacterized protein n=1 Tax=Maribacter algarum (ex Zhang et al. 2020) TaxID=2578118 RepID=A0A5S3QKJ2_9FLAO|nr:hypothetical protein [Maribacter algarum]TMM58354.1 hypothetical protein FEE95_02685 [Maribacter algarum]